MYSIDSSQRTAAKIAGWSGLLTFAIVMFSNYVLLDPLMVPRNAVDAARNIFELIVSFWLLFKGLRPSPIGMIPQRTPDRALH